MPVVADAEQLGSGPFDYALQKVEPGLGYVLVLVDDDVAVIVDSATGTHPVGRMVDHVGEVYRVFRGEEVLVSGQENLDDVEEQVGPFKKELVIIAADNAVAECLDVVEPVVVRLEKRDEGAAEFHELGDVLVALALVDGIENVEEVAGLEFYVILNQKILQLA